MAVELYLPQGRMVYGDAYKGRTMDRQGKPLVTKTGQPRTEYLIGYAIRKNPGVHWQQEPWGQQIVAVATAGFPQGQSRLATFSWKITDGDSTEMNQNMKRPCDQTGYAGHWVLSLKNGFGAALAHINPQTGRPEPLLVQDAIVPGDYVQAHVQVAANGEQQKPGVYINPNVLCLMSKGERIVNGPDVTTMAFGGTPVMPAPVMPAPPPLPVVPNPAFLTVFPPAGWTAHPSAPGYFYKGQEVLTEADLKARVAAGAA